MSLAALVDRVAARQPASIAISGSHAVTYLELQAWSRAIAEALLTDGCRRVGVFLPSSTGFFASIVGVNRTGAAFVPLDPALPVERLRQMASKAELDAVITSRHLATALSWFDKHVLVIDSIDAHQRPAAGQPESPDPAHLCYVIFTSGSTGHPKGCMVSFGNLDNFIENAPRIYSLTPRDRLLQFASISFDTFLEETIVAWSAGAALVLNPQRPFPSHHALLQFVRDERISVLDLPSSLWHSLVDELAANPGLALPPSLTTVIVGGESVSRKHMAMWLANHAAVRVINTYGISECAIVSSAWTPAGVADLEGHEHTPIGAPLEHVEFTVLDEQRRPSAVDTVGELYICGASVGDGYINDEALTRASFVTGIPGAAPGTVFYRTGDRVKRCRDGLFEYVGRIGSFININGMRVDLGEIENVIRRAPGVQDCKVLYSDTSGIQAFITPRIDDRDGVVTFARQYLPHYMIPRHVVTVPDFPVNRHGKVSESALRALTEARTTHPAAGEPVTEVQSVVRRIFEGILQAGDVTLDETFFELGGDSITSMNLLSQIKTAYDVDVPLDYLFGCGTVRGLAEYIEAPRMPAAEGPVFFALNRAPFVTKTILLIPGSLGDVMGYSDLVTAMPPDHPIYGTGYPGRYDERQPFESLAQYAEYYADAIDRQQLQAPFVIAGYSSGGWIAYALASELRQRNVIVETVFLLDSAQPNYVDPSTSRPSTLIPPFSPRLLWFFLGLTRFFVNELIHSPGAVPMILRDTFAVLRSGKLSQGVTVDEINALPTYLYFCARIGFFGRELAIPGGRYARGSDEDRFALILRAGQEIGLFPDAYGIEDIKRSWQIILSIVRIENISALPAAAHRLVLIRTKPHYGLRMFFPAGRAADFGWGALVGDRISVFEVAGTHLQLLRKPFVQRVVDIMRASL